MHPGLASNLTHSPSVLVPARPSLAIVRRPQVTLYNAANEVVPIPSYVEEEAAHDSDPAAEEGRLVHRDERTLLSCLEVPAGAYLKCVPNLNATETWLSEWSVSIDVQLKVTGDIFSRTALLTPTPEVPENNALLFVLRDEDGKLEEVKGEGRPETADAPTNGELTWDATLTNEPSKVEITKDDTLFDVRTPKVGVLAGVLPGIGGVNSVTLELVRDKDQDESSVLGVCAGEEACSELKAKFQESSMYEKLPQGVCALRCYTGAIHAPGEPSSGVSDCKLHPGNKLRIDHSVSDGTVTFTVINADGTSHVHPKVVSGFTGAWIRPFAFTYGSSGCSVRIAEHSPLRDLQEDAEAEAAAAAALEQGGEGEEEEEEATDFSGQRAALTTPMHHFFSEGYHLRPQQAIQDLPVAWRAERALELALTMPRFRFLSNSPRSLVAAKESKARNRLTIREPKAWVVCHKSITMDEPEVTKAALQPASAPSAAPPLRCTIHSISHLPPAGRLD